MSIDERRVDSPHQVGDSARRNGSGNGNHNSVETVGGCGGPVRRFDSRIQRSPSRSTRLSRHARCQLENSCERRRRAVSEGLKQMGREMESAEDSGILEALEEVERLVSRHLERVDHDDVR